MGLLSDDEIEKAERLGRRTLRRMRQEIHRLRVLVHALAPQHLTVLGALRESAASGGAVAAQWVNAHGVTLQAVALSHDDVIRWRRVYGPGSFSSWQDGLSLEALDATAELVPISG